MSEILQPRSENRTAAELMQDIEASQKRAEELKRLIAVGKLSEEEIKTSVRDAEDEAQEEQRIQELLSQQLELAQQQDALALAQEKKKQSLKRLQFLADGGLDVSYTAPSEARESTGSFAVSAESLDDELLGSMDKETQSEEGYVPAGEWSQVENSLRNEYLDATTSSDSFEMPSVPIAKGDLLDEETEDAPTTVTTKRIIPTGSSAASTSPVKSVVAKLERMLPESKRNRGIAVGVIGLVAVGAVIGGPKVAEYLNDDPEVVAAEEGFKSVIEAHGAGFTPEGGKVNDESQFYQGRFKDVEVEVVYFDNKNGDEKNGQELQQWYYADKGNSRKMSVSEADNPALRWPKLYMEELTVQGAYDVENIDEAVTFKKSLFDKNKVTVEVDLEKIQPQYTFAQQAEDAVATDQVVGAAMRTFTDSKPDLYPKERIDAFYAAMTNMDLNKQLAGEAAAALTNAFEKSDSDNPDTKSSLDIMKERTEDKIRKDVEAALPQNGVEYTVEYVNALPDMVPVGMTQANAEDAGALALYQIGEDRKIEKRNKLSQLIYSKESVKDENNKDTVKIVEPKFLYAPKEQ